MTRVKSWFVCCFIGLIGASMSVTVRAQPAVPPRPPEMTVVELVRAVEESIVRVDLAGLTVETNPVTGTPVEKAVDSTSGTGFAIGIEPDGAEHLAVSAGMTAVVGFSALVTARRNRVPAFVSVLIAIAFLQLCGFLLSTGMDRLLAVWKPRSLDFSEFKLSCLVSVGWFLGLVIDPAFLDRVRRYPGPLEAASHNDGGAIV